jgi:hypothetical protein
MSSKSDLRGAIEAGVPVGVVAGKLTSAAMFLTIPRYLDRGGKCFCDSGAFSSFLSGEPMHWADILQRYDSLALMTETPRNLYVVAPDKVGDQDETLRLLAAWAVRVRRLIAQGCKVIVPIQCGRLSGQALIDMVAGILQTRQFIVGIPSNRAAMPIDECRKLRHSAFHILGRVQADVEQRARIQSLRRGNPAAAVTADANWMRSQLGTICDLTEAERADRRQGKARFTLDHPRTAAVTKALLADPLWGVDRQLAIDLF